MTKSKIEWTDRSWNPVKIVDGVATLDASQLIKPLKWRKPQRCFVGDPFAGGLTETNIDKVFSVMALASHITFQILTKRPDRMRQYLISRDRDGFSPIISATAHDSAVWMPRQIYKRVENDFQNIWPLPNVWLGVSVHDQASADEFVPLLLETPAALRFVSYEPALGRVDWKEIEHEGWGYDALEGTQYRPFGFTWFPCPKIDWIIAGGESGPNARPAHPDWIRQTRDQCAESGTAFFFKQWGEWATVDTKKPKDAASNEACAAAVSNQTYIFGDDQMTVRVGKSVADNQLDGRTRQAFPDLIVI